MTIKKVIQKLVVTHVDDKGVWLLNFDKYNSEDDLVISEQFAKEILNLKKQC